MQAIIMLLAAHAIFVEASHQQIDESMIATEVHRAGWTAVMACSIRQGLTWYKLVGSG